MVFNRGALWLSHSSVSISVMTAKKLESYSGMGGSWWETGQRNID